jgi:protein SERAC1
VSGDRSATGDDISEIAKCIKGMIFLGTPFGGANAAGWGEAVRRVFDVVKQTDNNTLRTLKKDSHDLKFLRDGFPDVIRKRNDSADRIGVVFFYERLPTYKVQVCMSCLPCICKDAYAKSRLLRNQMRRIAGWARSYQCVPII